MAFSLGWPFSKVKDSPKSQNTSVKVQTPAMNLTAKMKENKKEEKAKLERVMPVTGHKL